MTVVTISHTAERGTLLEGTVRGDGTYQVMSAVRKAVGHWRWARSVDCWIVVSSRDRQPKQYYIDYAAKKLREAGYTVELAIDRTARATEDAEADRASRQSDRVDALQDRASRKDAKAVAADAANRRAQTGGVYVFGSCSIRWSDVDARTRSHAAATMSRSNISDHLPDAITSHDLRHAPDRDRD